jgi:hypothetical protein
MKITIHWFLDHYVITRGELDQTDGRYVFFEPEKPADKILDRDILPIVQKRCDEIMAMDKAFRASDPDQFEDKQGNVWKRLK